MVRIQSKNDFIDNQRINGGENDGTAIFRIKKMNKIKILL